MNRRRMALSVALWTAGSQAVFAQPSVQAPVTTADSAHAVALARLLRDANVRNRLPAELIAYKANVETEIAVLLRREDGSEIVASLEQIASTLRWTRAGGYAQRVVGYRAQEVGLSFSMLSLFQTGWINPTLYGSRLRLRTLLGEPDSVRHPTTVDTAGTAHRASPVPKTQSSADSSRAARQGARDASRDTLPIVHPLADDRDRFYEFTGGDTLVTIQTSEHRIPIVRVHVKPRPISSAPVALFVGDIDLDASRGTLVRLRGYFVRVDASRALKLFNKVVDAIAFVEYEDSERDGRFWLPATQRIELQVSAPMLGEGRAVIRIVSRFPSMAVNDTTLDSVTLARADSLRLFGRRRLSFAAADSMSAFRRWRFALGDITTGLRADDFDDVGPERRRATGTPRVELSAPRATDVLHFNRVEGVYTGLGARLRLRDVAPGVTVRANAGWAWSERTTRGRVSIEQERKTWTIGLRGGRSLDITNDFRNAADSGNAFVSALTGTNDPYDYVDRRSATLYVVNRLHGGEAQLRSEVGVADDRYAPRTVTRQLTGGRTLPPDRGVDGGGYTHSALTVEWHPGLNVEFAQPGVTARVRYERGDGSLAFQRAEARALARTLRGPFTMLARLDAGILLGNRPPPQQLFELGSTEGLPGYAYKTFAGTQAAALRGQLQYTSPFFRHPIRLPWHYWFPAFAPGLSAGVQGGWTDAPGATDRASIVRLGFTEDSAGVRTPRSRTTDGVRATVTAGFHIFGGSIFIGEARPIDHRAGWHFMIGGSALLD